MSKAEFEKNFTGLQNVGIPTLDMDGTLKFYEKLGFQVVQSHVNKGKVNFLRKGDLTIETYEDKEAIKRDGSIQHISLDCESITKALEYVKSVGIKIENKISELPIYDKGVKSFTIRGPNEEVIEFYEIIK